MVSIGEESGDLARLLNEVADYYDKEVGYAVENLTTMIEPLVIVIVGVIVGTIVISIYLPMFDLSSGATL
jgi:type IV pilus assembly protein PilC